MMIARVILCVVLAAALSGCASGTKKKGSDGRASSLVYSPAARLPADRGDEPRSPFAAGDMTGAHIATEDVRPPAGRRCRVHFRREAMGVAGQAPYPIAGNNIVAERAQITGTLERVGGDWLVVRAQRSTYWVPREAVLAIEFADDR